jgi:hypothetical protein
MPIVGWREQYLDWSLKYWSEELNELSQYLMPEIFYSCISELI